MSRQTLEIRLLATALCLAIFACSEDSPFEPGPDPSPDPGGEPPPATGNVAPEIAPIADQIVLRNTLSPRTLELNLEISDPDDDVIQIAIESDDETVLAHQSLECSPGTCPVMLTPSPERTAAAAVRITATDASGDDAMAQFRLDVSPRLVTELDDSGPGTLRAAVTDAEPGDVIAFDTAGVLAQAIELQDQIVLDKVLTIEGPGAGRLVLSGGGAVRIFRVNDGAHAVIRGVTITNGRAPLETFEIKGTKVGFRMGGGVLVDAGGKLTLSACAITASIADEGEGSALGGGIGNLDGTLVLNEGTEVTGNGAAVGGGIAILSVTDPARASLRVDDAVIARNEATLLGGGGVYNHRGAVVVHASVVQENTASLAGGIHNNGELVVEAGSIIARNTAKGSSSSPGQSGGGGIHNEDGATATITGSTIESNTAVTKGGGIRNHGTLEVGAGTLIRGNETGATGGGVHNAENAIATIRDATIEVNEAESGGGVSNKGETRVQDSRIAENSATASGGGYFQDHVDNGDPQSVIENTTIESNTAANGGGLTNGDGKVTIERNSLIAGNVATGGTGGGIDNRQIGKGGSQPSVVVDSSTITGNRANTAGGGIHNWDAYLALINGTIVSDNYAPTGGGLKHHARQNAVTVKASLIGSEDGTDGGNAALVGGGIYNEAGTIDLRAGSRVQGNVAEIRGGGMLNDNGGTLLLRAETRVSGNAVIGVAGIPVGGGIYNLGTIDNLGDVSGNTPDDVVP